MNEVFDKEDVESVIHFAGLKSGRGVCAEASRIL